MPKALVGLATEKEKGVQEEVLSEGRPGPDFKWHGGQVSGTVGSPLLQLGSGAAGAWSLERDLEPMDVMASSSRTLLCARHGARCSHGLPH